jgi:4-hydroxybenzoate polyprenyltransferase
MLRVPYLVILDNYNHYILEFAFLGSYIIETSRPNQWIKNLVVFIPVLFSFNESWTLLEYDALGSFFLNSILAFIAFVFITISVYFINDVFDKENDRKHPIKKFRPIASGNLTISKAIWVSLICIFISLLISLTINLFTTLTIFTYLVLMVLYSYILKKIIFLDVISISLGFVIRVVSGAIAIGVPISIWLCLCMMFGALFIAVSKRFSEIWINQESFSGQRLVLGKYSKVSKSNSIYVIAAIMIVTILLYVSYTLLATNLPVNNSMLLTIPLVFVGMSRYLYIVVKLNLGEKPESIVMKDLIMRSVIITWSFLVGFILYYWR